MRFVPVLLIAVLAASFALAQDAPHKVVPERGYVPDADTAISVAVAVWLPIYGRKAIAAEKPYHASLMDGVWTVKGSLPKTMAGGVAVAEISMKDGTVLRVSHGK
jgi:hypothetical protein